MMNHLPFCKQQSSARLASIGGCMPPAGDDAAVVRANPDLLSPSHPFMLSGPDDLDEVFIQYPRDFLEGRFCRTQQASKRRHNATTNKVPRTSENPIDTTTPRHFTTSPLHTITISSYHLKRHCDPPHQTSHSWYFQQLNLFLTTNESPIILPLTLLQQHFLFRSKTSKETLETIYPSYESQNQ
jgi:hypothetical protein